ncbi:MAG: hypothetical protein V4733_09005 [Verrucomicrobiota bacterium]
MSRRGLWLSLALFPPLLGAQETPAPHLPAENPAPPAGQGVPVPVLPDSLEPGDVDVITPVPPPVIPFGAPLAESTPLIPKEININNQGGTIEGNVNESIRLGGPIKVTGENGMEIFADSAVIDTIAKTVTLEGDVSVFHGNVLQRGDRAVYHYDRKFLDTSGLRGSVDPLLLEAGRFRAESSGGKTTFVGEDVGVTTHDVEHPSYWIRAKKTRVYPGERVVFHDLKLYAGDIPVFWLPYLSQPLHAELGYHFIPGARSNWGPFILNTYGIMLGGEIDPLTGEKENQWLLSRWHFDVRTRRGAAFGFDLADTRLENSDEISGLSLYYLNDLDPSIRRSGLPRGFINEDRYRAELKHRIIPDFPGGGDWRLDVNLTHLGDSFFLEDFDRETYHTNPQPDNTVGLYRRDDASLFSLVTRFPVNDFYRSDTRLPEIAFDRARAPLFGLPVMHEGTTSFGLIGETAGDVTRNSVINPLAELTVGDPRTNRLLDQLSGYERALAARMIRLPLGDSRREELRKQLSSPSYSRFHTYQEVSTQHLLGGFLSISPQAGVGFTGYNDVEGAQDSLNRTHLHTGVEAAVKFSKDYGNLQNRALGLNGLLHVVQPYANWSIVSTDDFSIYDPRVDRLTPTTRPRPLDPARFTAIDEMRSWNIVRTGVRNRILTRRDGQSHEWMVLDSYVDGFIDDPEEQRDFSNLYNDLNWQPLPWLGLEFATQSPIVSGGSGFQEYATRLHFTPNDRWWFSLGHRWLDSHPVLLDSNRADLDTYLRLSENWGIATKHTFEADDGTLEYQQYSLHRDFGNWVAGMGFSSRDNRIEDEYGVVFSLTLKDFPSVSLPFELQSR